MAEPTPNPSKTTEPTPPTPPTPPEPPAPNNGDNQKAIDDAVAAAKEKWEKEVEEKLKEFVGHTKLQVAMGALLGIVIAVILG